MMSKRSKLDKRNIRDIFALTPMQEGLLYHYLQDPEKDLYFEQLTLDISGKIDLALFVRSWNFVIETNEMLRAVFHWEKLKNPIQIILKDHKIQPKYYDISRETSEKKRKQLNEIISKDKKEKFNLQEVPFRVSLCKVEENKYKMIISNHHILYDGWSNGILLKEFFSTYNDLLKGKELVKPVKTKFKEFINWSRGGSVDQQEKFWKSYLKEFVPPTNSPIKPRRKEIAHTGDYQFSFAADIKDKIEGFVKKHKVTMSSLLYSVWGLLLQQIHSTGDVLFDTTVSGRSANIKGIENIIGLFINTLPLRVQTRRNEKIVSFLSRMDAVLQQWREFENTSLITINEYLDAYYRQCLFDSVLVLENYPLDWLLMQKNSALAVNSFSISGRTQYDLTIIITIFDDIRVGFTYNNDLFDKEIIELLANDMVRTISQITDDSQKKISGIIPLSEKLRTRIVERCKQRDMAELEREQEKEFPKTARGKVPGGVIEEKLLDIWSDLFRVEKSGITIDMNFFDFGGHSLKASLLAAKIHQVFNARVPLVEIFKRPTIKELASYITQSTEDEYIPLRPVEKKEYHRTSAAQKRLFMLHQLDRESTVYNGPLMMILEGPIDKERINKSFKRLIQRHESLRTSFHMIAGEPAQRIQDKVEFQVEYFLATEVTIKNFIRSFGLSKAPLLRVGLVIIEKDKQLLIADMHHIITDGISMDILTREFVSHYKGEKLSPPRIRYKDFSEWQDKRLKTGELKHQEAYWLNHLSGELPILDMPLDYPRPTIQRFEGERIRFQLEEQLTRELNTLSKKTGTTLYMILLATYNLLLAWYTGQEDIIVGTPSAGRNHADLENTIGFFLETMAIRSYPTDDKLFNLFLEETRTTTLEAYENQDYPFRELIKKVGNGNHLSRNPVFDVMLNVLNQDQAELKLPGVNIIPFDFDARVSKVDLTLEAREVGDKIVLELEYCTALFKRETIERLSQHFVNILRQVLNDPHIRLSGLEILNEGERKQILVEFNNTGIEITGDETVIDYFASQAEKIPDHAALVDPGGDIKAAGSRNILITYKELDNKSNQFTGFLRRKGVGPDIIVGIMAERSVEMIIGILGILKAGGAYLPIDPDYPAERIAFMLKDSGAEILLKDNDFTPEAFTTCPKGTSSHLHLSPWVNAPATSLAYIIYTSGSTGRPKGVMVTHKNLVSYLYSFEQEFTINNEDVVIQQASCSFDVFGEEVFPCLVKGGRIVLSSKDEVRDTALLTGFIARHQVTVIDCSPLLLNELNRSCLSTAKNPLRTIHTFISGGDVLKGEYVNNLIKIGNVYNTYGPTETTICATYHKLSIGEESNIPIGKPIANYRVYIINKNFRWLPVGVPGEICIAGVGVSRGYLNQPELTAKKFLATDEHGRTRTAFNQKLLRGDPGAPRRGEPKMAKCFAPYAMRHAPCAMLSPPGR
ncbi:MAG: amino acid adenylation domain-containing protein, partial [Candidatus Aminicenantes bacterium]